MEQIEKASLFIVILTMIYGILSVQFNDFKFTTVAVFFLTAD
jgi:hypothetical protein